MLVKPWSRHRQGTTPVSVAKTLSRSKIVGSEEEAKRKIYNVSCEKYLAFGCEIDEETLNRLKGIPGVRYVLPDSYVDPEYKTKVHRHLQY